MTESVIVSRARPPRARRPWLLWSIAAGVLVIAGINAALAWDHLRAAGAYRELGVSYPPELRAGLAALWAGVLGVLGLGLIRRRQWARRWILLILSNYGAFGVLWLLAFAQSDAGRSRIAFQAALTALLLAGLAWITRWRRFRAPFVHAQTGRALFARAPEGAPPTSTDGDPTVIEAENMGDRDSNGE